MTEESNSSAIGESSNRFKYAHIERERRFLLVAKPWELDCERSLFIQDRYLLDSRLRLRRIEELRRPTVYKLGQKIRLDNSPRTIAHTTVYLSETEFDVLSTLPASTLEKTRHLFTLEGLMAGIDEFGGELDGLVLAEVDLGENGAMPSSLPHLFSADVTDDEHFTGGSLSNTSSQALVRLLSRYRNH